MPSTVRFHRVLRATPERVYRAFLDADAMAKWLPPNGFTGKVHQMDAKVGGTYKMSFTNFTTGNSHSFGGKYLELVPNERIRYTDQIRRSEPARRNADDDHLEEGVLRNRDQHRAGGDPGRDSRRGLLPRLAGIADPARATRRGGDTGVRPPCRAPCRQTSVHLLLDFRPSV